MCDWCEKATNASRPTYEITASHNGVQFKVVFCTRRCQKAWVADAAQYGTKVA